MLKELRAPFLIVEGFQIPWLNTQESAAAQRRHRQDPIAVMVDSVPHEVHGMVLVPPAITDVRAAAVCAACNLA